MNDSFISRADVRNLGKGLKWGLICVAPIWVLIVWAVMR